MAIEDYIDIEDRIDEYKNIRIGEQNNKAIDISTTATIIYLLFGEGIGGIGNEQTSLSYKYKR